LIARVQPVDAPSAAIAGFPEPVTQDTGKDGCPYPGLAAYSETDAENFFGRDREISNLWRKITSRRLLAVIGPSRCG
jgi:hypothetical protein